MSLEQIYQEMVERNSGIKTVSPDPLLLEKVDERYCYPVFQWFSRGEWYPSGQFSKLVDSFPDEVMPYTLHPSSSSGVLHWTFLQLLGFDAYDQSYVEEHHQDYYKVLYPLIQELLPLRIDFRRSVVTPKSILMLGFPDKPVNQVREKIRKAIKEANLRFVEPYVCDIVHTTVGRFVKEYPVEKIGEFNREEDLGYVVIKDLFIGPGTWKLLPDEVSRYSQSIPLHSFYSSQ